MRTTSWGGSFCVGVLLAVALTACGDEGHGSSGGSSPTPTPTATAIPTPANLVIRERIASLVPSANLGHRGTGTNQDGNEFPENSLASFQQGIREGADGIELDVELTSDLELVVMHDDTLDRTTTCQGCVSAYTFEQVRACRLRNFAGTVSDEPPPTLAEVFAALPSDALVNIELKVYDRDCLTPTTGATALAQAAVAEVHDLGVADRSIFSSFSPEAAAAVKAVDPELYSALLIQGLKARNIDQTVDLGLDAIHPGGVFPFVQIPANLVADARSRGLQVNVWTVDDPSSIAAMIAAGATAIITNEPNLVAAEVAARR